MLRCSYLRLTRNVHFIPIGGSTPLGALGHVNAGLELAEQVETARCRCPRASCFPSATGSTMAGLALGLLLADLDDSGRRRASRPEDVMRLAEGAAHCEDRRRARSPRRRRRRFRRCRPEHLRIVHDVYGGAYGRPLPAAQQAAEMLKNAIGHSSSTRRTAQRHLLLRFEYPRTEQRTDTFLVTFDGRWLTS